jgi:hypothetical protein
LQDDDEVAVLHGPEEMGYPPLTEAMVNIRATLAEAARQGILVPQGAAALTAIAKSLFYKERSYSAILEAAAASSLPAPALRTFADWLPGGRADQKRRDAVALIEAVRAHLAAGVEPPRVSYRFSDTAAWQAARRDVEAGQLLLNRADGTKAAAGSHRAHTIIDLCQQIRVRLIAPG